MPTTLRLLRPALAFLALGAAGRAVAQSGSSASPFMPPASAMVSTAAPSETLEFAGINVMGEKTFVSVFDKQTKKGRWIAVGGSESGISVLAYDPRREQIVVKSGDIQKTLTLRKSNAAATLANAPSVAPQIPAAGFATTLAPGVVKIQPPPPDGAPLPGPAVEAPPPGAPVPVTQPAAEQKPLTVARQEEEARMLVSDLLEIGMAQRKAYEEAQKKASAPANEQPAPTPNPGG